MASGMAGLIPVGGNGFGRITQTAGTTIEVLVPPRTDAKARITKLVATAAGTAHVATCLRPIGTTTLSADAAAGQAVINLTADPGPTGNPIAANDWLAIRRAADGTTRAYKVLSVSTLAVTLTANLGTGLGLAAGDKVWNFGVAGDTDPRTGLAHPGFTLPASATTSYSDPESGVVATLSADEPILVQDNNATAAGTVEQVSYLHTRN